MMEQNEQAEKSNTAEWEYVGFWPRVGAHTMDGFLILLIAFLLFEFGLGDNLNRFWFESLLESLVESLPGEVTIDEDGSLTVKNFSFSGSWEDVQAALVVAQALPALLKDLAEGLAFLMITAIVHAPIVITFWVKKQATPGKMGISAKIVDADTGERPSVKQYIGRYIVLWFPVWPVAMLPTLLMISMISRGNSWSALSFLCACLVVLNVFVMAYDKRKQGWHDRLAGTVVIRKKNLPSTAEHEKA